MPCNIWGEFLFDRFLSATFEEFLFNITIFWGGCTKINVVKVFITSWKCGGICSWIFFNLVPNIFYESCSKYWKYVWHYLFKHSDYSQSYLANYSHEYCNLQYFSPPVSMHMHMRRTISSLLWLECFELHLVIKAIVVLHSIVNRFKLTS